MIRPVVAVLTICLTPLCILSQQSLEKKLASQVSRENLLRHVRALVAFGNRQGGTPSGDAATTYLMKTLTDYGLPTTIDTNSDRLVYGNQTWSLAIREPRRLRKTIRNEWLSGYSPSVPTTSGNLTYLSEGEAVTSGLFDSSVVLTGASITTSLYRELVDAGAMCVLTYAPNDPRLYPAWALIGDLAASDKNEISVFNISYSNGAILKKELEKGTRVTVRFSSKTRIQMGTPKTVIATLTGRSVDYYIVCAHGDSDSGGPGADDNASGVAGVLELARVLSAMVASRQVPVPEKTIKFIVWGSEYHSSTDFVKERGDSLEKILGVLNYDEIGTGASRNCLYFEGNDIPVNETLLRSLNAVGEEYAGRKGFWDEATTNPAQGGTDSYVFLPEYLGRLGLRSAFIPSVTVYTAAWNLAKTIPQTKGWLSRAWKGHPDSVTIDFSPYYHSSLDVPAVTTEREPFNMEWAVKAVGIVLHRLAWGDR